MYGRQTFESYRQENRSSDTYGNIIIRNRPRIGKRRSSRMSCFSLLTDTLIHSIYSIDDSDLFSDQMVPRPLSANGTRRSTSVYSGPNEFPDVVRFKVLTFSSFFERGSTVFSFRQGENIIMLQLDFPTRTTRDYEGPMVSPMIQAAIENAMKDEDHIELNAR